MTYQRTNIYTGWGVWLIATIVYLLTIEPTSSFWDCGEFIASAYKLEVGHPPGAPFFMMLARLFSIPAVALFGVEYAATAVNVLSALCSSFTILFLFWSITHFAKKIADKSGELTSGKTLGIMGAGLVGALAYTFSDSFWFSAVEGEVYAMSSLFTAVVFWAILKWESVADRGGEMRWIILIAYLMGLSIGVHLLNLLAIPAIAFVYYFKRNEKATFKGIVITGVISLFVLGFVQTGIIQGFFKLAAKFELMFVNELGMGFNTGTVFYFILVTALIAFGIWFSHKKNWRVINISSLGILMVLIGYSTFAMIVIRSSANPPMDENNPENLFTLLSYLNREQYGDRPLTTGQYWNTPIDADADKQYSDGNPTWVKSYSVKESRGVQDRLVKSFRWEFAANEFMEANGGSNYFIVEEYVDSGEKKRSIPNYDRDFTTAFPRMYSSQANHVREYKRWSNYKNWNVSHLYSSPFIDGMMDRETFAMHIDTDLLNAGFEKKKLERNLNKLFGEYKIRTKEILQVRAADELLIRSEETGEYDRLAVLSDDRTRQAVAQYLADILSQGVKTGRDYVTRLDQAKSQLESDLRIAVMRANRSQSEQDYNLARQIQGEIDRIQAELQPEFEDNWKYFVSFQMGWMYGRYFMWNFAGKQNDAQGHGDFQEGNWLTGLDFIDEQRLGNRSELPSSALENKGFNKYLYFPLILGLIGLIFQAIRAPKDFFVVMLLFILTGAAIVVYLNQTPYQPRERDYAYVGSFYAFAMWIGLGAYGLFWAVKSMTWKDFGTMAGMIFGAGLVFLALEKFLGGGSTAFSYSVLYMGGVAVALFAVAMLLQTIPTSDKVRAAVPVLLCMIAPILMGSQGWDDHSRAKRRTGVDFAKNYLKSLDENAILFTNGDNDTFPLWYVQEVEGFRTDVRIVNLSLLNTDWYIDQMKRQAYKSAPVPFEMPEEKYRQGTRDIVLLGDPRGLENPYVDVASAMEHALDDTKKVDYGDGRGYFELPSFSFSMPVDKSKLAGVVSNEEMAQVVDSIKWSITDENGRPKSYILKNHFMVLELLKNNDWSRPIYFAVTTGPDSYVGLQDYFRLEGLAYRLVPIRYPESPNPNVQGGFATDKMYDKVMNEFVWGNMDDTTGTGIYMDENNRRMTTNLRLQFTNLAEEMMRTGDGSKALDVLNKLLEVTPEKNVPFDRVMLPVAEALLTLSSQDSARVSAMNTLPEDREEALVVGKELSDRLFTIFEDEIEYYLSLDGDLFDKSTEDLSVLYQVNARIVQVMEMNQPNDPKVQELKDRLDAIDNAIEAKENELIDLGMFQF
ncbi:MAG: DUF2723 domain-containing protein [Flavobacteriales bacterium]|nr:DUF2723 domain-containing protein [Flavobacteriales bacterium]